MLNHKITVYTCEKCGFASDVRLDVEDCEKKCNCPHDWEYRIYLYDKTVEIVRECQKCQNSGEALLSAEDFTQGTLREIFNEGKFNDN